MKKYPRLEKASTDRGTYKAQFNEDRLLRHPKKTTKENFSLSQAFCRPRPSTVVACWLKYETLGLPAWKRDHRDLTEDAGVRPL